MPQVPTYGNPQVREQALQGGFQQNIDVSSSTRALGQGLMQVAEVADRAVVREAETEAWQAQSKITDDFDKWDTAERQNSQGAKATGYRAKVDAWWADAQKQYTSTLSPLAQRAIGKSVAAVRNSTLRTAGDYETQQVELGARSALSATTQGLIGQGIKAGPDAGPPVITAAVETVRKFYNDRGLNGDVEALKASTGAHTTIINQLMQRDPKAAEAYFNTHKKQIDPTSYDEIGARLNQVSAVTDGEVKATELWNATVKPGDYKNPVDQFALEKQAREAFPNDPTRQKAAIGALREMTASWNKSQVEFGAANVNEVYRMLDQPGVTLTRVMRSKAWSDLPEQQQRQIRQQLENESYTAEARTAARESRAAAAEQRAAAREARAFTAEQRKERQLLLTNADAYLRDSDPAVLAGMSRQQVEAKRAVYGFDGAQHLLSRWDTLQKPGAVAEARMDTEDFNHIADRLGMDPYNANSPTKKQQLGELKYRLEQMIDAAQRTKKATLTREEKAELMRSEMARVVTVNPGWWVGDRVVPVIQLRPEEVANVVVPQADKAKISEALRTMYVKDPKNPEYAPTDDNVRRLYLTQRSRAAALIQGPTK